MRQEKSDGMPRANAPRRADVEIDRGHPLPFGATVQRGGVNFAVVSRYATSVVLLIFGPESANPVLEIPLDARFHRTGEVWHAFVKGLDPGFRYAYCMDRVPNAQPQLHRFDPAHTLVDPYAKAIAGK